MWKIWSEEIPISLTSHQEDFSQYLKKHVIIISQSGYLNGLTNWIGIKKKKFNSTWWVGSCRKPHYSKLDCCRHVVGKCILKWTDSWHIPFHCILKYCIPFSLDNPGTSGLRSYSTFTYYSLKSSPFHHKCSRSTKVCRCLKVHFWRVPFVTVRILSFILMKD